MRYILTNDYGQYLAEPYVTGAGSVHAKYTEDPRRAKDFSDIWQAQEYAIYIQKVTGSPTVMQVAEKV